MPRQPLSPRIWPTPTARTPSRRPGPDWRTGPGSAGPDDESRHVTSYAAAEAGFVSIGLDGWADRARDELATTGEKTRRATQAGDQLTSQETRVALLVARGLSNREIAAALFLSPKTIEHHVTSALRKRNMRSRTELAVAFAGR